MTRQLKLEKNRLDLIEQKDGLHCAVDYSRKTMLMYRKYILKTKEWTSNNSRRCFIDSYLDFKAYYLKYKDLVYGCAEFLDELKDDLKMDINKCENYPMAFGEHIVIYETIIEKIEKFQRTLR